MNDVFKNEQGQPRVLRGVTLISGAPRLAELAGRIGFDTVWIEVEHGPAGFAEVETLCVAAEAAGAIVRYCFSESMPSFCWPAASAALPSK